MKKKCGVVWLGLCTLSAFGQEGLWEQPFNFGPDGGPYTRAINLVHVWNGSTTKVLALSGDGDQNNPLWSRLWTPPPVGSQPGDPGQGAGRH